MRGSVPRALAVAVVIGSGTAAVTWAAGRADTAEAATTKSQVVLDDDFSGDRGTAPDAGVWSAGDSRATAWLDGEGRLTLGRALRSATTFTQAYGRAEARIRMERPDGPWRALGLLDAAGQVPAGQPEVLSSDRVDPQDFHTYAIDWTPTTLTWSLDGRDVFRFTPEKKGQPMVLVLNGASGGRYPASMVVDQVKVTVQVPVETASAKPWKAFIAYQPEDLVKYREVVYRVREAHTSLPDWKPDLVPALFEKA